MRIYRHFELKSEQIFKDLKETEMHASVKIELIKHTHYTFNFLKKTFQDSIAIDNRALMSNICKTIILNTAIKVSIFIKFIEDIEGYEINAKYIVDNYAYLRSISVQECSITEVKNIITKQKGKNLKPKR